MACWSSALQQNHFHPTGQRIAAGLAARADAAAMLAGEDGGNSLAAMAQRDLDAALQLLANRAQYITGATGAAIALRRHGRNDMLCRASTGSNAPELGALLSTEIGLSGESVRTRQFLRCDDAERDARVNREVCRQLGIASVMVMPVVNDDELLGVFELFSGKTNAFGERDVSAVRRLSEMVETAVRLAQAAEKVSEQLKRTEASASQMSQPPVSVRPKERPSEEILDEEIFADAAIEVPRPGPETAAPAEHAVESWSNLAAPKPSADAVLADVAVRPVEETPGQTPAKKLFWSAALSAGAESEKAVEPDQSHVPPVLRALRKCEACGFPISAGRVLCVECEEKKWRGQLKRPAVADRGFDTSARSGTPALKAKGQAFAAAQGGAKAASAPSQSVSAALASVAAAKAAAFAVENDKSDRKSQVVSPARPGVGEIAAESAAKVHAMTALSFAFSGGIESSESWFSRNKYVLGVLLVVAGVVAAFLLFR
jgi:hypothetical protein